MIRIGWVPHTYDVTVSIPLIEVLHSSSRHDNMRGRFILLILGDFFACGDDSMSVIDFTYPQTASLLSVTYLTTGGLL